VASNLGKGMNVSMVSTSILIVPYLVIAVLKSRQRISGSDEREVE
jgi:hypothetical protein